MGTCWNCNTQVTLKDKETKCDFCGEIIFYKCNNCHYQFEVIDKKTKKKLKECKLCGYFICPECGVCYYNCDKYEWEKEILKILRPEITQGIFPNLGLKVNKIIEYFENVNNGINRKSCPERNVPISYAKGKIKSLRLKFLGFKAKNKKDQEAFLKRIDEITNINLGKITTVTTSREDGTYGQEYRDAFNFLVCLGKYEINKRTILKDGKKIEHDIFIRCEKGICPFLLPNEKLTINKCPKCSNVYSKSQVYCSLCKPYKTGKNKGELIKLKESRSNLDGCQVYRGDFKKVINGKSNQRGKKN